MAAADPGQIHLRLPDDILKRVDSYIKNVHKKLKAPLSRTIAIQALIVQGLEVVEKGEK